MPEVKPNRYVTPHFKLSELACPCCGLFNMGREVLRFLEDVRSSFDRDMIVNSGVRCEKHNKKVGGKPDSNHLRGEAVDIKCDNSFLRAKLIRAAIKHGVQGIGVYQTFIHLDVAKRPNGPAIWLG